MSRRSSAWPDWVLWAAAAGRRRCRRWPTWSGGRVGNVPELDGPSLATGGQQVTAGTEGERVDGLTAISQSRPPRHRTSWPTGRYGGSCAGWPTRPRSNGTVGYTGTNRRPVRCHARASRSGPPRRRSPSSPRPRGPRPTSTWSAPSCTGPLPPRPSPTRLVDQLCRESFLLCKLWVVVYGPDPLGCLIETLDRPEVAAAAGSALRDLRQLRDDLARMSIADSTVASTVLPAILRRRRRRRLQQVLVCSQVTSGIRSSWLCSPRCWGLSMGMVAALAGLAGEPQIQCVSSAGN